MMVLVADDDERLRAAIGIILKKAGYQVCEAGNGIQALSAFDEKRPDIAILDVMMPKLDGFEVCEIIRKSRARTPVLFLTAKSDIADKKSGFRSGGDDYLVKPFNEEELLLRVEALLRRSAPHGAGQASPWGEKAVRTVGSLRIDVLRFEVFVDGRKIDLTKKEFQIFSLLSQRPGEVYTADEIIEHVWGIGYLHSSVSIPTHIRHIREKIEADPAHPKMLQTVWRFGYRLGD